MTDDFVTRLQLQLRDAAEREARTGAFAHPFRRVRWHLGSPVVATAAAALLVALAVAGGALLLRGEPEPAGPHVVARLELTGNPEQIGAAFGSFWIADPVAGEVVRVDPESRRVTARIPVGPARQLELAEVGNELWVIGAQPTQALRIDPDTDAVAGRVRFRTPDGRPFPAITVFDSPAGVWAVGDEGALRLGPGTPTLVSGPTDAGQLIGAAIGEEDLWVLRSDGRIQRFDAATGEREATFRPGLPGTFFIATLGTDLLALGDDGTIARLDGGDGHAIWERSLGEHVNRFDLADGLLWMHTTAAGEPDRLTAITADRGRTVASAALDTFGATGLAVSGREIWIDTAGGQTVVLRR
jgi:hypothetical protein